MKDADKLKEYTDDKGNLVVDRLSGGRLQHVSVLEYGANGREVSAAREAGPEDAPPQSAAQGGPIVSEGGKPADIGKAIAWTDVRRAGVTFEGVLSGPMLMRQFWLLTDTIGETLWRICYSDDVDDVDKTTAIAAAIDSYKDYVLRAMATEVVRAAKGDKAKRDEMMTVLRQAIVERSGGTMNEAEFKALVERVAKVEESQKAEVKRGEKTAGLLVSVLRAIGLPDGFLTELLGQYGYSGQMAGKSTVGDLEAMIATAIGGAASEASVVLANVFNRAKGAATSGEVTEALKSTAEGMKGFVKDALAQVFRQPKPTPGGIAVPSQSLPNLPELSGISAMLQSHDKGSAGHNWTNND